MLLSVKPGRADQGEARDERRRDRQRGDEHHPMFRMKTMITRLASRLPSSRCSCSESIDARMNCESSRVTVTFTSGRQRAADLIELRAHRLDDFHRVLARLPPHVHDERALAVEERRRPRLLRRVLDRRDVAQADRRAVGGRRRRCSLNCASIRCGPSVRSVSSASPCGM
jgi:hypothetical protein